MLHRFTYYGITVTYKTGDGCNTKEGLIKLLNEHPEGIEIYIRDLPHAVLLTRYDAASGEFYVADPVYEGERTLMTSWERKAGSTQAAVIRTIDAYWYISNYENKIVPGKLVGEVFVPIEEEKDTNVINDEELLEGGDIADDEEIINFIKSTIKLPYVKEYNENQFIDVDNASWYASYVKTAYQMAMMIGISDNEFHVNGNITLAQTICITARLHSMYYEKNHDFTTIGGEPWFMPYVRYVKENNMLDEKYMFSDISMYDREALRIEFSEIIGKALPSDQMTEIKTVEKIVDIPTDNKDERFKIIYDLYKAGILIGDGEGFKPYRNITRAEIAAVVSRVADASLRIE